VESGTQPDPYWSCLRCGLVLAERMSPKDNGAVICPDCRREGIKTVMEQVPPQEPTIPEP
jgi:uncharacterized Zn finger protein (UPF0148 family)